MNIMHYTVSNYENGSLGGVARFDHELKKVFQVEKRINLEKKVRQNFWTVMAPNHF